MRKNNKKVMSWLIGIAIFIFIIIFLYATGFRITYKPELKNDWNAIGAGGEWVGVVVAAFVAIIISYKQTSISEKQAIISEQQNKIAMFEKRLEYYQAIQSCHTLGGSIEKCTTKAEFYTAMIIAFDIENFAELRRNTGNYEYLDGHARAIFSKLLKILHQGDFLFEFNTSEYAKILTEPLSKIMIAFDFDKKSCEEYIKAAKRVGDEFIPALYITLTKTQNH